MSLMTKYGSFWGMIPQTSGRYFWVAPAAAYTVEGNAYESSDDNDGLSPDRALRTYNRAIALATASVGDVIVGLPGAHSVLATILINKAGLTFVGIPGSATKANARHGSGAKRLRTSITSTQTAGIIFTVSAPDTEIAFFHLLPPAAGGRGISLTPTLNTANRAFIHDCTFALQATASVTTYGITVPAGVTADILDDAYISNCYFVSGTDSTSGANGPAVNLLGTARGMTIENSTFELKGTAAWAAAISVAPAAGAASTLGTLIRDNDFINPTSTTTVITTAVSSGTLTTQSAIIMYRNFVDAGTDGATAAANNVISLAENYLASVASPFGALFGNV
jgi:hypothetical protein